MCSNCSNYSSGNNAVSDASVMGSSSGSNNNTCRIAVTVEDNFAPCTFPERYFDVLIKSRDGNTTLTGRVVGGGSAIFTVPCGCEYAVTVTGNEYSSPRSQTRRVNCICGQTAGVTFIFMTFEPDCPPHYCPPCPPPCYPVPCPPPCPPVHPCPPPHPPRPPKPIQPRASLIGEIINEIISDDGIDS